MKKSAAGTISHADCTPVLEQPPPWDEPWVVTAAPLQPVVLQLLLTSLPSAGTYSLEVENPQPGGGLSASVPLGVPSVAH